MASSSRIPADEISPKYREDEPLPVLKDVTQMKMVDEEREQEEIAKDAMREFTDVKFYPYTKPGVDPIFACINARHILICRATASNGGKAYDVIKAITDTEEDAKMYSCVWSKNATTGSPLLIAGGENATIQLYDVLEGALSRTLLGPGGRINDMAICPTNPNILAVASADDRATIWNLHPDHAQQPIMLILAGTGGHRESLLSVSWHLNGQYLVTGGEDKMIKVWHLPEISYPPSRKTQVIQDPVFSTSAVHSGHVECVKFFGDLVLSKAHEENKIVLWKIEGFSSEAPPPPKKLQYLEDALSTTFSDFCPESSNDYSKPWAAYTRLVQFAVPDCQRIYMRFGLYIPSPSSKFKNPILSLCNSKSKIFFWDLARLDAYTKYIDAVLPTETVSKPMSPSLYLADEDAMDLDDKEMATPTPKPPLPSWLKIYPPRKRDLKRPLMPNLQSYSQSPSRRSVSPSSTTISNTTASASTNTKRYSSTAANTSTSHTPATEPSTPPFDLRTIIPIEDIKRSKRNWDEYYSTAYKDRWRLLKAHKNFTVPVYEFTGRQMAWDSNGEWCVVAGSENVIAVCGR